MNERNENMYKKDIREKELMNYILKDKLNKKLIECGYEDDEDFRNELKKVIDDFFNEMNSYLR